MNIGRVDEFGVKGGWFLVIGVASAAATLDEIDVLVDGPFGNVVFSIGFIGGLDLKPKFFLKTFGKSNLGVELLPVVDPLLGFDGGPGITTGEIPGGGGGVAKFQARLIFVGTAKPVGLTETEG